MELRLEESETELKQLKIQKTKQEAALQIKARTIEDLQSLLETLESDNLQLQEDLKSSTRTSTPDKDDTTTSSTGRNFERSQSYAECSQMSPSAKELQEVVEDLTKRLSDLQFQKTRMKQSTETVSSENRKLKELLMKAESEAIDLQAQVKFLEELNSEKSEPATPIPPQSPGRRALLMSSMSNPGNMCPHCSGNFFETSFENSLSPAGLKMENGGIITGSDTLFSELENELNTLQIRFDRLLQDCTCSASVPYKDLMLDTPPPCGEGPKESITKATLFCDSELREKSLKDLFEEVYASLKQTSVVADQLLIKKKGNDDST